MPVDVLVLEDEEHGDSLLQEYIAGWVASAANEPGSMRRLRAGRGPGAGHLGHLLGHWPPYHAQDFKAHGTDEGDDLGDWAALSDEKLTEALTDLCKQRFNKDLADVLIVDLGLTARETGRLIATGGDRGISDEHLEKGFLGEGDDGPLDPRKAVESLTGFRILRAYARLKPRKRRPVIVTTGATNPLVIQHCRASGAFAVVRKPVPERRKCVPKGKPANDFYTAAMKGGVEWVESAAENGRDPLAVVVNEYLSAVGAEVLKAVVYSTVQIKGIARP